MSKRKKLMLFVGVLTLCFTIYFGYLHMKIREYSDLVVLDHAEYMIILGARVKGTVPSLALQYRIDAAAQYLTKNPQTIAIASGGKGPGEEITEAEAIKRDLTEQGIHESRIILEDKSTNTIENINFSKKLIPNNLEKGLIVSNDFHIFRAKMIARDQGIDLEGLPAKTPTVALLKSYTREYLAITKYFLNKYIF
ncbi:YdcF family protein [Bacillus sp. CGMCC 1.16607]|uniref:YdcF family protein n=1 Tax=Bacillus sp. CGMCC 1.16607 TaxID=3351842 RepID=UPI003639E6D3